MIKIIESDIFEGNTDVIIHQVNCQGVMGSGIAKQVKNKFPIAFSAYKTLCDFSDKTSLLGKIQIINNLKRGNGLKFSLVNVFSQDKYGYSGQFTDYEALKKCLLRINEKFAGKTIGIPYLMGCHRGGGDWNIVSKMISENLKDCEIIFYKYSGK